MTVPLILGGVTFPLMAADPKVIDRVLAAPAELNTPPSISKVSRPSIEYPVELAVLATSQVLFEIVTM